MDPKLSNFSSKTYLNFLQNENINKKLTFKTHAKAENMLTGAVWCGWAWLSMSFPPKGAQWPSNEVLNGRIVGGNLSWKEDTWKNTIKSAEMLGVYWIITNAECKLGTWYKLNS